MSSLFSGLNTAKSGLIEGQTAINVASHNIANANTEGYTREALSLVASPADGTNSRYRQSGAMVGNGVQDAGVSQYRDAFLDLRYRNANAEYSDYSTQNSGYTAIENIFNEFTSTSSSDNAAYGLSGQLSGLVSVLQKFSSSSDTSSLPAAVQADAQNICATIREDYSQLTQLRDQESGNLSDILTGGSTGKLNGGGVNAMLDNIAKLNTAIADYEVSGQTANDLRDSRNQLLDQLSGYLDITVTESPNGMVQVGLQHDPTMLVSSQNRVTKLDVATDAATGQVSIVRQGTDTAVTVSGGQTDAYLHILNGDGSGSGSYGNDGIPYFISQLNTYASVFQDVLNHTAAADTAADPNSEPPLITYDTDSDPDNPAATINISSAWQQNRDLFATEYTDYSQTPAGTGVTIAAYAAQFVTNLQSASLATLQSGGKISGDAAAGVYSQIAAGLRSGSLADFADSFTSDIAYAAGGTKTNAATANAVLTDVDTQRQSISSVSTDEEIINVIKYQQAYSASARVITTIDAMLDKLVNGTGVTT